MAIHLNATLLVDWLVVIAVRMPVIRILFLLIFVFVSTNLALKCRTRERMRQQQDFYNLAANCMKTSTNTTSSAGSSDYNHRHQAGRPNRPDNYDDYYDTNRHTTDSRYDRNNNVRFSNIDEGSRDGNMCNSRMEGGNYRKHDRRDEMRYSRYRRKRDTTTVQKYVRKNSTSSGTKKSPLEEIGACVIHCIFREMKMLNSDSKADRQAMSYVMTNRIQNPELREFIQDSIEECFDIMDSGSDTFSKDGPEEQCEFSKKLILCLEEKAKRGCEDWEVSESSSTGTTGSFSFNKQSGTRNNNEQMSHQKY